MTVTTDKGTLATTAANRYEQLSNERSVFLERAKRASLLTIPFLFHEAGANSQEDFQSLGARCVNNLAAKLLLALFPPGAPFFKLTMDDYVKESLGPEGATEAEAGLAKMERAVAKRLESTGFRSPVSTAIKHLVVSGNGLLQVLKGGRQKFRTLESYVVSRDLDGNVLEIITKDELARESLPPEVLATLVDNPADKATGKDEKTVELYTWLQRTPKGSWTVHQEVGGQTVDGSQGKYPKDKSPFIPLRFTAVDGEDYGRGYVEEFLGDLSSYDALQQAIVSFAAVAAKVLLFVDESGYTQRSDIERARNGDVLEGSAKDVTAFMLDKGNDFQIAQAAAEGIKMRLEQAFLMASSAQRNAERVTAEEIRLIAGELEQTLGGIYSVLAEELQMPFVVLTMAQLQRERKLPALPADTVSPQIVTGLEGLGRNSDLQRIQSFVAQMQPLGPAVIAEWLNVGEYLQRTAAALSIDPSGLVRTQGEVDKARQDAAQQALQEKAVAPAINAASRTQGASPADVV